MDKLHQAVMELEYVLDSVPHPDTLFSSWEWRNKPETGGWNLISPPYTLSPASDASLESCSSSPCSAVLEVPCSSLASYRFVDFPASSLQGPGQDHHQQQQRSPKPRMSVQRRRKASEREKLRMRNLAEALLTLRNFLPPVYSQGGRPLTKIQTLKCTIQYIRELSDLLNPLSVE
ncbi:mesogenin-1 [Rhinatrema bivittatum]|uniref:mesogenin-1-like n=1 Tax=Rhinatrema bivittatum TaxID=194408 RepID=UPI00112C525C|nr:mesogenin-1-like [Rhinatrema bivittatum]XP_029452739.1 mesogenin-1 [Rhinatrema bivittatum]